MVSNLAVISPPSVSMSTRNMEMPPREPLPGSEPASGSVWAKHAVFSPSNTG